MKVSPAMKSDAMAIAVFKTHNNAEKAVKELQHEGFDMTKLSIVGKDFHTEEQVIGYVNMGDRIKTWGSFGALWGGLFGALTASGLFFIPVIGHIFIAGPILAALAGALEGSIVVGGFSALGAALMSLGIPKDSAIKYETAIKSNQFVLIVHGTQSEIARAQKLISELEEVIELNMAFA